MCLIITKKNENKNLSVIQSDYEQLYINKEKEKKVEQITKKPIFGKLRKFLKKIKILKYFHSIYLNRKFNNQIYLNNNKNFKKFFYEKI